MVSEFIKKIINNILNIVDLKIIRIPRKNLSGQYLFDDLKLIVGMNNPVCFDIGANRGQTIDALCSVFSNPVIHAFEPSSGTFDILEGSKYSKNIHLHKMAVGSSLGELEFFNYEDSRLSSLLPMDVVKQNPFQGVALSAKEIVAVETVDNLLIKLNIEKLDLLKIDTQGFDYEVLKGAEKSFMSGKIDFVMLEMNFIRMYEGQAKPEEIISYLSQRNIFLVDLYEKVMYSNQLGWCTALFVKSSN